MAYIHTYLGCAIVSWHIRVRVQCQECKLSFQNHGKKQFPLLWNAVGMSTEEVETTPWLQGTHAAPNCQRNTMIWDMDALSYSVGLVQPYLHGLWCQQQRFVCELQLCLQWNFVKLPGVKWSLQSWMLVVMLSSLSMWHLTKSNHLFFISSSLGNLNKVTELVCQFKQPGCFATRMA